MRERVLDIVNLITQYILETDEGPISEQELINELMAVGYQTEEIDDALVWMEAMALQPPQQDRRDPLAPLHSYRIFSVKEEQALTSEARGFLIKIRTMGLLDDEIEEEIIDRALQAAEDPINIWEIKLITMLSLLTRSERLWMREIDCFLDNDWGRIYH